MTVTFPETVLINARKIRPNEWNPNIMPAELFNELVENIEGEMGFVQPIIVSPIPEDEQKDGYEFKIIDGEHRFDGLRLLDVEEIPCIVKFMSEDDMKFQTVKMNRLRGKFDHKKFNMLVKDLLSRHSFEEVAARMAFTDPTELEGMIDNARESLPDDEMRKEFDKSKGEIKTVDDLASVLNRLFTQYGDTMPYNFMVLDFGGKNHIWVRMNPTQYRNVLSQARECMAHGVTFDSVLSLLITEIPMAKFIKKKMDLLEEVSEEDASKGTVIMAEEDDL
jgi:hypothetical protein